MAKLIEIIRYSHSTVTLENGEKSEFTTVDFEHVDGHGHRYGLRYRTTFPGHVDMGTLTDSGVINQYARRFDDRKNNAILKRMRGAK